LLNLPKRGAGKYAAINVIIIALLLVSLSSSHTFATSASPSSPASSSPQPVTPIHHIVFIIQENHAFDQYFGAFPGVVNTKYGLNLTNPPCLPQKNKKLPCVKSWDADSMSSTVQAQDLPHNSPAYLHDYDGGKSNGFVSELPAKYDNYTMAYYTNSTIPDYWDYAEYYTLDNYFFASALSLSLPNHLYAVAASDGCKSTNCVQFKGGPITGTPYNLTFPQIAEYLTPLGITWGYYQWGWNDSANCPPTATTYTPQYVASHLKEGDSYWTGLTEFTQVQMSWNQSSPFHAECSSLNNYDDLMNRIENNTLPDVSWVIPASNMSDHPGQSALIYGQEYVASVVNAIEQSPAWNSTVIYLTDDESGGYYDGMTPLQVDSQGDGYRVPLIAISPYSRQGDILHLPKNYTITSGPYKGTSTAQEDFSAFISTIEYNWNLTSYNKQFVNKYHLPQKLPLTARDKDQPNLFFMLNFSQPRLRPLILPMSGSAVYPYTSCIKLDICSLGSADPLVSAPLHLYVVQPYNWTESVQEALNLSGTGDADD
jgi:phospholipase C